MIFLSQFTLYLYLLTSISVFNISTNDAPWRKVAFFIGFSIIAGVLIFLNVSKKVKNSRAFRTGQVGHFEPKSEADEEFKKSTKGYGLKKEEVLFLKELLKGGREDPQVILADRTMLDILFKQQYQQLAKEAQSSKEALDELTMLFSVRNAIAFFQSNLDAQKKPQNVSQRAHLRKSINTVCICRNASVVKVHEKGKVIKKFEFTGKSFQGSIMDISAGGCAITTLAQGKAGDQVKIEFKIGKSDAAALALVLRVNRSVKGSILYMQFIKVPPKTLSIINGYVFNYL